MVISNIRSRPTRPLGGRVPSQEKSVQTRSLICRHRKKLPSFQELSIDLWQILHEFSQLGGPRNLASQRIKRVPSSQSSGQKQTASFVTR